MDADKKYTMMTESPVNRLVIKMAVPTIISMMMSAVYNMADTYFVGQLGKDQTAAVGLAFPLMAIIQAFGFMIGMGSGNTIARLLGRKEREEAERFAATGIITAMFTGILLGALGLLFLRPLAGLLGAPEAAAAYTVDYIRFIFIGAPFMMTAFVLNNIFRLQGSAFFGMIGMATGGLINIILDPIFIFGLNMGVSGAALATMLSQVVGFCILLSQCGRRGNLPIRVSQFKPSLERYRLIFTGGFPSFCRQSLASVATVLLNRAAAPYGTALIAAVTVVGRLFQFAISAVLGVGQGFQPVCGFNYGARKLDRVLQAFWFAVRVTFFVLLALSILAFILAPEIVAQFNPDAEVVAFGARMLRMIALVLPLAPFVVISNMLLQTIGKTLKATLTSLSRQGLFFIPLVFLLPRLFGANGVLYCQPVSEALSFVFSVIVTAGVLNEIRNSEFGVRN